MVESVTHPVLGVLRWEKQFSWWFTQIQLESGDWLDVIVDPGDENPFDFLGQAARLYCQAMVAERVILQEAIQKGLLDLYEHWRQEDEPRLTAAELKHQLELTFVRIDTFTPITLSYVLGDVFGGYSVDVQVDETIRLRRFNLVS